MVFFFVSLATAKGFAQPIISGHICPYQCDAGYVPTQELVCRNGKWTDYSCVPRANACVHPQVAGFPSGVIGLGGDFCATNTPMGTKCRFNCRAGQFGWGKLQCSGSGWKFLGGASCLPASGDNLYDAPTIEPVSFLAANVRVKFKELATNDPDHSSWDGKKRSMIRSFNFRVSGPGLHCPVSQSGRSCCLTAILWHTYPLHNIPTTTNTTVTTLLNSFVSSDLVGLVVSIRSRWRPFLFGGLTRKHLHRVSCNN